MIAALIVVVLVAAAEAQSAQTGEATHALEAALEPGSVVLVRASTVVPDDVDLSAIAASARADAAAAITWTEGDGQRAHLRVQRATSTEAVTRDIEFKPSDAPAERGKTLGFAIASMLPSLVERPAAPVVAVEVATRKELPAPLASPTELRWAVDLALATTLGLGGDAGGVGGAVALGRELTPAIDARAVMAITRGAVSDAQASLTMLRPRAGVGLTVLRSGRFAGRVRLEAGPWLHLVNRSGSGRATGSRWLFGGETAAEIAWTLAPRVALTFDVGLDVAFGTTRVIVGAEERASIPPVRVVGDAGARLLF